MTLRFTKAVERIPVYPAASGYGKAAEYALMASNESPEPPLESVVEAARLALTGANRYPDPSNAKLRAALAERYEVPASRIQVGNGSCDILLAAGEALLEDGAELLYAWPSFSVYPHLAAASGARAIEVPLNDRDEHDLDAMLAAITAATTLVLVCNPNNPTSTALPLDEIRRFVEHVPDHVCVILDEAYCEYNTLEDPDASIDLLEDHPNLVLLRTFSKVYGLCGLRVGYALCGSNAFVTATTQVRQPFYCNIAAQAAAVEALKHGDEIAGRVERAVVARITIEEGLRALGMTVAESQANFVWFELRGRDDETPEETEARVLAGLTEAGFQVRAGGALGRAGWLRVSFGTDQQNDGFLSALGALID
ncbi:MAG: aminotransferase class I/II-fold pyridoxal phosphate-dependent enzyme [Baekduia sp.]